MYIRFGILRPPNDAFVRSVTGKGTAGGRSQPLMASGGCSELVLSYIGYVHPARTKMDPKKKKKNCIHGASRVTA